MHLLLIGNYGAGNFGDEAMKDYFLRSFGSESWTVVSAHPSGSSEIPRLPAGIRSFIGLSWLRTIRAFRRTDGVVFGGGSLFTDAESVRACWLWWMHAMLARWCGKPLFFAFQGIGPFRSRVGEWLARSAARRAAFLSVRDAASAARLEQWGLHTKVIQSFDPVFSLFEKENKPTNTKNVLVIIPRQNSQAILLDRAKHLLGTHAYDTMRIVSFQPDDPGEQEACCQLLLQCPTGSICPVRTVEDLEHAFADAAMVLTERFHGAIAAVAEGLPVEIISQAPGDKLDALRLFLKEHRSSELLHSAVQRGEQGLRDAILAGKQSRG